MNKQSIKKRFKEALKRAYQQMQDVDAENLLKGFKSKVGDPTGYEFLEGWLWNFISKEIDKAVREEREKRMRNANELFKTYLDTYLKELDKIS